MSFRLHVGEHNKVENNTYRTAGIFTKSNILLWLMLLNATFNTISVIAWRSVLLVEETGLLRENHIPAASH